jgi:apolipoprotein N-acyltransferase
MTDKKLNRFLLLAVGGVLTGLTLVLPKLGFLQWITLVPIGIFLLSEANEPHTRLRGTYGYGFFFFMCYYCVVFHWFVNLYPLEFIDGMTPVAAITVVLAGCVGLSAFQSLFGGLMFIVARLCLRTRLLTKKKLLRPLFVAGIWAVYEWTQTLGWWGVPWGRLAIGQSEYVVSLQTASLLGSYFITFVIVAVNLCIAYAIVERKAIKLMGICAAALIVFQYGAGTAMYFIDNKGEGSVRIAAVQGNISSLEKWDHLSGMQKTIQVYGEYTHKAAAEGADIVLWPETALPDVISENDRYGRFCSRLAKETGVTILVGAFTEGDGGDYNSIIAVLPDGSFHKTVYSKQRLVPFGEFVPFKKAFEILMPPLAELVMRQDILFTGTEPRVMELEEANIGCLICFDSIYEDLARASVNDGAQIICLSTNDSWFSDSAALYMHNAQAQLRAIESGRWVVRSANTGISTIITDKGRVVRELDPLVDGMLVEDIEINSNRTLYSVIGNVFVYLWIGILIILCLIEKKIFTKEQKN